MNFCVDCQRRVQKALRFQQIRSSFYVPKKNQGLTAQLMTEISFFGELSLSV